MTSKHRDLIEHDAIMPEWVDSEGFPTEHEIEFSKAISLKRLANSAAKIEDHLKKLAEWAEHNWERP